VIGGGGGGDGVVVVVGGGGGVAGVPVVVAVVVHQGLTDPACWLRTRSSYVVPGTSPAIVVDTPPMVDGR
jgi:hypothetical protein